MGICKIQDNWARSAGGKEGCINRKDIFTGCVIQARAGREHNEPLSLSAGIFTAAPWKGPREQTATPAKLQVCAATTKCLEDPSRQQEAPLGAGCPEAPQLAEPDPAAALGGLGAHQSSGVTGRCLQSSRDLCLLHRAQGHQARAAPSASEENASISLITCVLAQPPALPSHEGEGAALPSLLLCAEGWGSIKGSRETRPGRAAPVSLHPPAPALCFFPEQSKLMLSCACMETHGDHQRGCSITTARQGWATSFREFLLGTEIAPPPSPPAQRPQGPHVRGRR